MSKLLTNLAAFALCVHGLIHLIGTVVYMSLGSLEGLPYETTLAGRWDVGVSGMAVFGMLWAVAGAAFVVAGIGLGSGATWWVRATTGAAVLSLLLSLLDSPNAYMGAAVDVAVLAAVAISVLLHGAAHGDAAAGGVRGGPGDDVLVVRRTTDYGCC